MTNRIAIYARNPAANSDINAIENQITLCSGYADQNNWLVAGIYTDAAAYGLNAQRPGFQQMIRHAREGAFDMILIDAAKRLGRGLDNTLHDLRTLGDFGCKLFSLTDGDMTSSSILTDSLLAIVNAQTDAQRGPKVIRRLKIGASLRNNRHSLI